jgi:hypothetical protein
LSDELREVNFCRVRLTELQRLFAAEGPPPIGGPSTGNLQVFTDGSKNVNETARVFLAGIDAEALLELDHRVQVLLTTEFTALVQVCLEQGSGVIKKLEAAMRQTAEEFAAARLPQTDVAEIFLDNHADPEEALAQLSATFKEASPSGSAGAAPGAELCVLAVPPGPGGDTVREWARQMVPSAEIVTGTIDTMLIYREASHHRLGELKHLGPAARDAYEQMKTTEHFTPHTRMDVTFRS